MNVFCFEGETTSVPNLDWRQILISSDDQKIYFYGKDQVEEVVSSGLHTFSPLIGEQLYMQTKFSAWEYDLQSGVLRQMNVHFLPGIFEEWANQYYTEQAILIAGGKMVFGTLFPTSGSGYGADEKGLRVTDIATGVTSSIDSLQNQRNVYYNDVTGEVWGTDNSVINIFNPTTLTHVVTIDYTTIAPLAGYNNPSASTYQGAFSRDKLHFYIPVSYFSSTSTPNRVFKVLVIDTATKQLVTTIDNLMIFSVNVMT